MNLLLQEILERHFKSEEVESILIIHEMTLKHFANLCPSSTMLWMSYARLQSTNVSLKQKYQIIS